jgi:hypothetical protein
MFITDKRPDSLNYQSVGKERALPLIEGSLYTDDSFKGAAFIWN